MLTVQQAAGTQFHSLLSAHSALIQGELYPIMTKNITNWVTYFVDKILKVHILSNETHYI